MTDLKILQIFSRYLHYGGEEGSVQRIRGAMQERFDVDYYERSTESLLKNGFLGKVKLPFQAFHNGTFRRELVELQRKNAYDVWQVHNVFPAISPSAYSAAFEMGVPILHYLHNYRFGSINGFLFSNGQIQEDSLGGDFLPAILRKEWHDSYLHSALMAGILIHARNLGVFSKIARWVAISHAQKDIHVKMGIPAERIDVVHHFLKAPDIDCVSKFPKNGYALFLGRLSEEKGVDRLLRAWVHLPASRKLVIAGDGPDLGRLQSLSSELGLGARVTFTGFVPKENHAQYWKRAAFSVVPSIWHEPFGMVVLEAWAQGRAVVANRIGALPELIQDGKDGFLAPIENTEDYSKVLENAFCSDALEQMGHCGWTRLRDEFNREIWLEKISEVYRKF